MMKTEAILSADVLDIIFDKRNKNYGAYTLRKFYNNRLFKALGFTFAIAALCFSAVLFTKQKTVTTVIIPDSTLYTLIPPANDPLPPKPKPNYKTASAASATVPRQKTQVSANNISITSDAPSDNIKDMVDDIPIASTNSEGSQNPIVEVVPVMSATASGSGSSDVAKPLIDKQTPRASAEIMPAFPGGMAALRKFLERNLAMPKDLENGQQVNVKVRFIVNFDGTLQRFEIVQDGGEPFNEEVIRVLKKMPQWIPGKASGENVSVFYIIPVKFEEMN